MRPMMSLARLDFRKDPWPQSWEMMKTRISTRPAMIVSGTTSHQDTGAASHIRNQMRAYSPMEFTICQTARAVEGSVCRATMAFHSAMDGTLFVLFSREGASKVMRRVISVGKKMNLA